MKIAMFTNTYLPHVGGVARSVSTFVAAFEKLGHQCLVIAPEFAEEAENDANVCRVPAITNFNDSGFSLQLPFLGHVSEALDRFEPDIIHAHHPFLLGDTAMRSAYSRNLPIVFTHHTLYEEYTGYLPFDGDFTRKAAMEIATSFANACSMVFAPSRSLATLIEERGVVTPIAVQPTGIDVARFANGDEAQFRRDRNIPENAPVIGHVGRLAAEKNMEFLAKACAAALQENREAYMLLVGGGDRAEATMAVFEQAGVAERCIATGPLQGDDLYGAYAAIDLFAFASQSETQGLVLAEAMAGGAAVIALDGPGVRDVLTHDENGLMLPRETSTDAFAKAATALMNDSETLERFRKKARATAESLSTEKMAEQAAQRYRDCIESHQDWIELSGIELFDKLIANLEAEVQLLKVKAATVSAAISSD